MTNRQLRARVILEEARALGLDLDDLVAASTETESLPTVASYLTTIEATFTAATARTYRPYWRLAVAHLGFRRLRDITLADLIAVVDAATTRAQQARPRNSGRASRETCVAALRALFGRARDAGLITANPAAALSKPRRTRSRRRALDDTELGELIDAVRTTSNDPDLDLLVLRLHLESGARREGALNVRIRDLDPKRATVWLREKGDSEREQPVSPTLVASSSATPTNAAPHNQTTGSCGPRPGWGCRPAATAPSSTAPAHVWTGPTASLCPPTSCATPQSPPWVASPATPSLRPSPATPRHR